jgi:hypothetical protein
VFMYVYMYVCMYKYLGGKAFSPDLPAIICVGMCMCVRMYVCTHTWGEGLSPCLACYHMCGYVHVCMYVCMYVHILGGKAFPPALTAITCVGMCMCVCVCMCVYAGMHLHTNIHTLYISMHACIEVLLSLDNMQMPHT